MIRAVLDTNVWVERHSHARQPACQNPGIRPHRENAAHNFSRNHQGNWPGLKISQSQKSPKKTPNHFPGSGRCHPQAAEGGDYHSRRDSRQGSLR